MKKIVLLAIASIFLYGENEIFEEKKLETSSTQKVKPFYHGKVVDIKQAGSYTYLEVEEHKSKTIWIAVSRADANIGDYVRFNIEFAAKNYTSKTINKTFKELIFASNIEYKVR